MFDSESESHSVVLDSLLPMDYTAQGILQAKMLEQVAFPFSRGSSKPRDGTQVFCVAGKFFTNWTIREAQLSVSVNNSHNNREKIFYRKKRQSENTLLIVFRYTFQIFMILLFIHFMGLF